MTEIDSDTLVTLLSAIIISYLASVEAQMIPHSRRATAIKRVEESVQKLAALTGKPLDEELIGVGVEAWGAMAKELQRGLEKV